MYKAFGKRLLDLVVAAFVLVATSPILVMTTILLSIQNRGKAFFFQERPGMNQARFEIIKFKTMTDERNAAGNLLPDAQRLTSFGKIVRKLSIDELPQAINVLKGDMSLIGPRPLLFKYVPLYSTQQLRRHTVLPGITGWAQVNGRNSISWTKKFELDLYYVDNISFALDCKIFWMTVMKIVKREGINQTENRPMEPFNGSN
jgi:lipopolysaccharide/colanic/teichoic acid biosynthesis glycosyltransferase